MDVRGVYSLRVSGKGWKFADKGLQMLRIVAVDADQPTDRSGSNTALNVNAYGFIDKAGWHGLAFPIDDEHYDYGLWWKFALHRKGEAKPFAIIDNPRDRAEAALRDCLVEMARADRGTGNPAFFKAKLRHSLPLLNGDDYPALALRALEEGRTAVRLTVSAHGVASDCVVTETSGSKVLDTTTCLLLLRRARFEPARDVGGQPTQGISETAIAWKIPE